MYAIRSYYEITALLKMVPMLVVMGTIFYLSSQSFSNTPLPFPGFDKIVHITIYAVLGVV